MARPLLFSDVDGTLLDRHGRYAMSAAELAPFARHLTIVLASSRTLVELIGNQRALGLHGPVIAENGAVIARPWDESVTQRGAPVAVGGQRWSVVTVGGDATSLRETVRAHAEVIGVAYRDQAIIAPWVDRQASVAIQPNETTDPVAFDALASALRASGLSVSSGGDWLAITRDADKGRAARALLAMLAAEGATPSRVAAVGDGDNDVPLLQVVDRRFAIASDDGTWHAALEAVHGVTRVTTPGIAGWRDVVLRLTDEEAVDDS